MTGLHNKKPDSAGIVTTVAFIAIVLLSAIYALANTIINEIVEEYSLTGTSIGLMGSMMSVGGMVAFLFIPAAQGRIKKIPTLITSCVVMAVILVAGGSSPSFLFYCTVCTLIGAVCAFIDTYSNSCIVDTRGDDSPKYLGYLHGIFGVGSLAIPPVIYFLLVYTGWRGLYFGVAAVSLIAALIMLLLIRNSRNIELHASTDEQRLSMDDFKNYFSRKRNAMLSAAAFFSTFVQSGMLMWIMRYMTVQFDAEPLGALSLSIYWVCATFTRIFLAHIVSRAPMKFFVLGAILSCFSIVVGAISGSAAVMCAMVGVAGLAGGHFIPVIVSENAKGYTGKTTFSTSVIMFIMGIARIITPLIMAYISMAVSMGFSMAIPACAAVITALFGWLTIKAGKSHQH